MTYELVYIIGYVACAISVTAYAWRHSGDGETFAEDALWNLILSLFWPILLLFAVPYLILRALALIWDRYH